MNYLDKIRHQSPGVNPFFTLMGIRVDAFGEGRAELSMAVRPDMLNGEGWLQGGLYTALCDEAMALALFTVLAHGDHIATVSESTSYLQGVKSGRIVAQARVVRKGRNIAFTEGQVMLAGEPATVLSRTSASFTIFRKSAGSAGS